MILGYRVKRDGVGITLIDAEGRQVVWLPGRTASEEPGQDWQGLCELLLMLAHSHAVECEVLRERVEKLEKRLREVEEERDTSDRIAEDLYEFFSRTAAQHITKKRAGEKGPVDRKNGEPGADLPCPGPSRKRARKEDAR